ncbi:MAG: acyl-CoA carboxylase [Halieaceae bacterium]|nr:acyl-CoA carboxylase [Halieaceae bacterium]
MSSHDKLRTELIDRKRAAKDRARPDAVAYQHDRGKLTARERIDQLCDESSFLEFGGLALPEELGEDGLPNYADGFVTGRARIDSREVVIASADFTVSGGSNGAVGNQKLFTCYQRAMNEGKPVVQLLEGGGHRIQEGLDARLFAAGANIPALQTQLSGWVPNVSAILGPGFAGPTMIAGFSDFVVAVKGLSTIGMAPPVMVKAGTGEEIDMDALGGAVVQANKNGVVDCLTESEDEALAVIKQYLSYLPANAGEAPPVTESRPADPHYANKLPEVVSVDLRIPYDVRDAIKGFIDQDSLFEIKSGYARNIVVAFARLSGRPIGIIANQPNHLAGALDSPACEKASHFICLCDAFGIPMLSLLDLPGFMVGAEAEQSKLARRSVRLFYEFGRASVPRYSIVLRKGYGAAYLAMNGGTMCFGSELSLAWPTAETAAMSVEAAIDVAFRRKIKNAEAPAAMKAALNSEVRSNLGPIRGAEGFGFDDVILPEETRDVLARSLNSVPTRRLVSHKVPRYRAIPPI